ncbi:MAG: glycerophosphodiester phosphodiesterase family protein [Lysobacterales bacterium]
MLPNSPWRPLTRPWVIAHRGCSGHLPEHTLPGYVLAIEQGCDVIEPDLVASADGVLYARHDLGLERSTDIDQRPEFAPLRRPGPDGNEDWWIADLTSSQIDQLRAVQPWPTRPHHRDGCYRIPRFSEILKLLLEQRRRRGRNLLVYPELKHPGYFLDRGIDVVELLYRDLAAVGLLGPQAPVLVQCFDADCLARVRERCGSRVVQLSVDLPALRPGVHGYGVSKQALLTPEGRDFIDAAHAADQMVHAWTFRDDQPTADLSPVEECARAYVLGCDGLFGDFSDTVRAGRLLASAEPVSADSPISMLTLTGAAIRPFLPALAQLRIRVFREWPYLYDGDLEYEARYLQTYSQSSRSLFVLAVDQGRIVGCATAVPLCDEAEYCQAPLRAGGYDVGQILYFGESVLDIAYRGYGLGHRFFDVRERYARSLDGITHTCFCAVERDPGDPRRPPDARSLHDFWVGRGYQRQSALRARFSWRELGQTAESGHDMGYWLRALDRG